MNPSNDEKHISKQTLILAGVALLTVGFFIGWISKKTPVSVEVEKTIEPEKIIVLDPTINKVITPDDLSNYNELTKSSYRLIVKNTEYEPCLTLDEVSVSVNTGPELIRTQKLCSAKVDSEVIPLTEGVAFVGYENIVWKNGKLTFNLDLEQGNVYNCTIQDVEQAVVVGDAEGVQIECTRS